MTAREIDKMYVYTNQIRKNSDITIIYPEEKIRITDKELLYTLIHSTVLYYHNLMEQGLMQWNGESMECRIKHMQKLVERHFYIDRSAISEKYLNAVIENILYIRRPKV